MYKEAEDDVKAALILRLGTGGGGTEWYEAKSDKDKTLLFETVKTKVKPYIIKSEAEAEDDDTTGSGNFRRRLQNLLTYLLNN